MTAEVKTPILVAGICPQCKREASLNTVNGLCTPCGSRGVEWEPRR